MTATANRPRRCRRCGAEVLPILDLAMLAKRTRIALDGMRYALPSDLTTGVRTIASALACYSQTCSDGTGPRDAA